MDLNELKETWKKEQKELEQRVALNEGIVRGMNIEKSKSKFEKYYTIAILGRTMALVYAVISFVFAYVYSSKIQYSLPVMVGGIAMIWSFIQHSTLRRPDIRLMNTLALQKAICSFRIHTSKHAKYDISIVLLWLFTLLPLYLDYFFKISIYSNTEYFMAFAAFAILVTIVTIKSSRKVYEKWDHDLKEGEMLLDEIKAFEAK